MNREHLFREAFRDNSQRIFRICSYFFIDQNDRNDAYQESLIRIWENLHTFRGKSMLSTWIYRVTVNTCLHYIRSDKRRNGLLERICINDSLQVAETPAEEGSGQDTRMEFLQRFMAGLNTADKTLVSLYLEDLSTRDMSEITGMSESNVRVRIFRIKEKIKIEWEETQHET